MHKKFGNFMYFRSMAMAAFLFVVFAAVSFAQTSKGILVGVVRDTTGAVIQNATITLVGEADGTTRTLTTKADGSYRAEALPPEAYTVTVTQAGFDTFRASKVTVVASIATSYDVKLSVGVVTNTIDVVADAASVNTENGQLAGVVSMSDIAKLPVFSVSPYELATTVPGVQVVDDSVSGAGFSNGINIQVNGARPRSNNFLIDGQEINDVSIAGQAFQPTIPDMYESLVVMTSVSSAEFGRAGGGVINAVTRSGSNTFHGQLFERFDSSALDAIGGNERSAIPDVKAGNAAVSSLKPPYHDHQYGFTGSGPIFKNKLFVYGGLSLQRHFGGESGSSLLLPDANGIQVLRNINNAQSRLFLQYLSNASYLSKYLYLRPGASANVGPQVASCPTGGCVVTMGYYQRANVPQKNPDTQWTYRVDYKPWDKDAFSFRYLHDRSSDSPDFFTNSGALEGFDTQQGGPGELGSGMWTHIFSQNLLNEFRVSETRLTYEFVPTAQTQANPLYALQTLNIPGIISTTGTPVGLGPYQNFPQARSEELYQFQDTVGWTKGKQSLRMGADVGIAHEKLLISLNSKGALLYAKGGTNSAGVSYNSALGNFLQNQLGPSGTASKVFGNTRLDPHKWRLGFFVQDDVKLRSDLTLNFGLRYDYLPDSGNSLAYPGIDPNNPFALLTLSPANTVQVTKYKIASDYNNVGPRVGFSYSPHSGNRWYSDGKMAIRGGVGMFYDSGFDNYVINSAQNSPNAVAGTLTQTTGAGLPNALSLVSSISPKLALNSSVQSIVKNLVNPITYQYNLGVERQLPANMLVAVRYVGATSHKLLANQQFNYINGMTGARLNPSYGQIIARGNYAASNYNGVQFEATHTFSHGFQVSGNYTYAKALDNGSEVYTTFSSPTSYGANLALGGRAQEWANSAYDHRQYLAINYVWSPAGFHASGAVANALLGAFTRHWTISGTETFQSGPYMTMAAYGYDLNGDSSTANDRPIVGNPSAPINTAAIDGHFIGGTTGTYYDYALANGPTGVLKVISPNSVHWVMPYMPDNRYLHQEIGRNSFPNPGLQWHNIALEKGFGLSYFHIERGRLIVRAEIKNIGNHNNVGPLDTYVTDIGTSDYMNRQNATEDPGRHAILWAKFNF